jgi:hypothetical protein
VFSKKGLSTTIGSKIPIEDLQSGSTEERFEAYLENTCICSIEVCVL